MYLFARAAETGHRELGSLSHRNVLSPVLGQEVRDQGASKAIPSEGWEGASAPYLSSSFRGFGVSSL